MCGIFGVVGDTDGARSSEALDAAICALQHRGPDSHGAWRDPADPGAALAHTRLRVIDLSDAAAQPMAGCDPRVRLTFNGEIYNHQALRRELEAKGHRFRSRSDGEAIVHGFEEWGPGVVERLDGMFAFGLWDGPGRRLLLARDRTGKKPLFYALSPDGRALRFASEVKALSAAGHPAALDPAALPMLLAFGYVPAPATLHLGVQQLAPGSRLLFEPGRGEPRVDVYWRPTFLDEPLVVSEAEAKARVRELVIAAVQRRLEADVPLGAFLSGGVDSTIIVGVMAKLLGRRVKTFSIGFAGDAAYDERSFAREASAAFGTEHTEFVVEPGSFDLVEKLVWMHDGPFADSSAVPTYTVARLTREHVTVALTGDGGDELFAGYLRFLAAEAAERVPGALREGLARLGQRAGRLLPDALPEKSLAGRARRFFSQAALPIADRVAGWGQLFAGDLHATLRPDVAAGLDLDGPRDFQRGFFAPAPGAPTTPLQRLLDHNFRTYLAYDLQPKVDRCTAGVGLEARSPFLDTALVEYAARLPDRLKRRAPLDGLHALPRTKHILREAFADLLPPSIDRRGKMGFGVPLATWFRRELRAPLHDLLGPSARVHLLLQRSTIERALARHDAGEDRSAQLWLLLTLEVWLRSLGSQARPASRPALSSLGARA